VTSSAWPTPWSLGWSTPLQEQSRALVPCPLLVSRLSDFYGGIIGGMCELLHTSLVVQKMHHGKATAIRSALGLSANHIQLVGETFGRTRAGTLHQPNNAGELIAAGWPFHTGL